MKNLIKIAAGIALFCGVLWACHTSSSGSSNEPVNFLPQDVCKSCVVPADTFKKWFVKGTPTLNGQVIPANSAGFPHNNNCDFYTWAENMFLWMTSPDSAAGGKTIMETPIFYNVSPPDSAGNRTFIKHDDHTVLSMSSHITKTGPNRLPVILDKKGKLFEVETAKPVVKNAAGSVVEVGQIKAGSNGAFIFTDKAGKVINHPQAIIQHKLNQNRIVQRFVSGGRFIFLDAAGHQVEAEQGQATGDVLMSQNHSLVYYLVLANDVYANYLTAVNAKQMSGAQFPITIPARDSVCAFARQHHVTLPDSNALAMEIKSAWVEASSVSNPGDYVIVNASIPTYDTTNAKKWIRTGSKVTKMALVGMHIVGSVAGHPEMVWATFEHQSNTPNAAFQYLDTNKKVKTVKQEQGKGWLFSNASATDTSYDISHMTDVNAQFKTIDTITADSGFVISPSNTLQTMPWGSAYGSLTNPEDSSSAASNSEVISINNSIRALLVGNDVRKNYLLIGATWTNGGTPPNSISYSGQTNLTGLSIGTSVIANTTMETYFQSSQNSCFSCHSTPATPSVNPDSISHVFGALQPLYQFHKAMDEKKKKK